MDRAFESGAVVLAPAVPAVPSVGFPTGGNPVGGVPATKPGAHWFHMITEELRALIVAGGLTPNPAVIDQVLQALPAALASRPEMARSLATSGYQKLPGGLIVQWGRNTVPLSSTLDVTLPIAFPSNLYVLLTQSNVSTLLAGSTPAFGAQELSLSQIRLQNCYSSSSILMGWLALGR